jgi:hypothetical protein
LVAYVRHARHTWILADHNPPVKAKSNESFTLVTSA